MSKNTSKHALCWPLALAALTVSTAGTAASSSLPPTTPQGVTLIEVMRELPVSQPEILWLRPGDAEGRTLFVYDQDEAGVSKCAGDCAVEFPPLAAPRGARPTGDWSIVKRKDGVRQWAYQKHPLHTWSKEETPGEVATNVGLTETANSKLAENPVVAGSLMPPAGWKVARFDPAQTMQLPDGIDARLIRAAHSVALTDSNGFTIYAFNGDIKTEKHDCMTSACEARWLPVAAPALAATFGDFSVVTRADGSQQWAYKKRPLFTNSVDQLPGDVLAADLDKRWAVAKVTENFTPAKVGVVALEGYGDALAVDGMTLYGGYSFEKRWGGRNLRDTFTNAYYKGKKLGTAACVAFECLKQWRPFMAPANAQPQGFWEPLVRPDGSKQWAYKGYALYTYAGDTAPAQHYGQATYDFANIGDGSDFKRVSYLQGISRAAGGIGIYWNIAKP